MAEGANYHLGITISATDGGVSAELKKIEDRFKKVANTISQSTSKINKSLQGSNKAIENHAKQYNNLNAKLNKIESAQSKQLNQVKKSESNVKKQTSAMEKKEKQVKKNTRATTQNTAATENWLSSNTRSLGIAIRSTVVWAAATTAIYGTQRALKNVHNTMMEVNAEMIALQRVMNPAVTDFKELRNVAGDLGVEYASNIQDIVSSMVEWGRQGRNQIETIELTEAALLATNVAQMDSKESVELLTAALLQFNKDASEAASIIDKWNEVANNFAVNATNLAVAVRESGSAAQSAGISMDELIGMTTALSAATAKSGSRIGRSLRTTFSRIMGDAGATEESLGKVEVALNSVGIALRKDENTYRNISDVLTDLSLKWEDLDEVMQANIARAIGGRRRYSDVIALVENWDLALDATSNSMSSLNSAIEENEKYMQGMEANWKQVRAEFNQIINTLVDSGLDSWSISIAKNLQNLLRNVDNLIVGLKELRTIIGAGLGFTVLYTGITRLIRRMVELNALFKLQGVSAYTVALSNLGIAATSVSTAFLAIKEVMGVVNDVGKYTKAIESASKAKKEFNKIQENYLSLSQTEIKNSKELITQYEKLAQSVQDFEKPYSYLEDIFRGIVPLLDTNSDALIENKEKMDKLRTAFPQLSEASATGKEFLERVKEELQFLNTSLEKNISLVSKSTNSLIDNTEQEIRQAKALEGKIKSYRDLESINNKTIDQQYELEQIQRNLLKQYPKLASMTGSFSEKLDKLSGQIIPKYTANSSYLNNVMETLETNIKTLKSSHEGLTTQYNEVSKKLNTAQSRYENLNEEQLNNVDLVRTIRDNISKYIEKQDTLEKKIKESEKTQVLANQAIESFKTGMEGVKFENFLANVGGAVGILEEFRVKVDEAKLALEEIEDILKDELSFQSWLGGKLDRTPFEQFEAETKVYENALKDVIEISEDISLLDPQRLTTKVEIEKYLEETFKRPIEELEGDIDLESIYDIFGMEGFLDSKDLVETITGQLIEDLSSTLKERGEKADLGSRVLDMLSIDGLYENGTLNIGKMLELPDEKLKEIVKLNQELREYPENLGAISTETEAYFGNVGEAAILLLSFNEKVRDSEQWVKNLNDEIKKNKEIEALINEYDVSQVGLYSDELKNVNEALEILNDAQKETTDVESVKRLQKLIGMFEEEKEIFKELNQMGELEIVKQFENFDISDVSSIEEAERQLAKLTIGLENFKGKFSDLSEEEMQKVVGMVGLDEDTIQKVFDAIREEIEDLEDSWYDTMAGAIGNALEQFDSSMSFTDKLSILIREGFSEAFKNLPEEEIQSQLTKVGSWLGDSLNLGDQFGVMFGDFATQAGKVFGAGGSVGQSFATGIGTVLTDSTQIGSIIGSLGQSIFGGVEGRKEMQAAKEINEQVLNTQSTLQEFGIFYDAQLATFEDKAGFLQSAFGGEDWDVKGLSKAKIDLEEMEEIIERVGRTAQDIFGKLPSLLSEGLSYSDFRSSFEDTVGQAMQDAVINKLLETQAIEGQIKQLAGMVEMAIGDAGQIDYAQLEAAQDYADDIMKRAAMINDVVKGLDLTGNNFQPDVTMDRTFRAGSTSAITYNNTFAVNSQIFLDDTAAAREAAKKLAPYIKDYLERHS